MLSSKAQIWIKCLWNLNHVNLFLTPSLPLARILPEMYWVFPLMCVCGTWSFFFGYKLRGVKFMWKHSPFGILADHSWLKHDDVQKTDLFNPGRCWWRCGVNLLACCLARALVFSAYGCHVPPPKQNECIVTCMCTKLYTKLQEYYFAVLIYFFFLFWFMWKTREKSFYYNIKIAGNCYNV